MKNKNVMTRAEADVENAERAAYALTFIREFTAANGYPPNRRELAEAIGASSASTAQKLVQRMIDEGLISTAPGISRSIVITGSVMKQMEQGL